MEKLLAVLATLAVGGMIAFQPPVNALLAKETSVLGAGFISMAVGTIVMAVLWLGSGNGGDVTQIPSIPPGYLLGGVMGAVLVTVSLVTVKTLGAGGVVTATVASQLIVSALLDRAGVLGLEQLDLSPLRLFGFALLLAGVAVVTLAR